MDSLTTLRGRAQSCLDHRGQHSGWAVTDYVRGLIAADNRTFQQSLEHAQTFLLASVCEHYELTLNQSKPFRVACLSALRHHLSRQRKARRFGRGHNSLFDRGSSDRYYRREINPHWVNGDEPTAPRVAASDDRERAEYMAGYDAFDQAQIEKRYD